MTPETESKLLFLLGLLLGKVDRLLHYLHIGDSQLLPSDRAAPKVQSPFEIQVSADLSVLQMQMSDSLHNQTQILQELRRMGTAVTNLSQTDTVLVADFQALLAAWQGYQTAVLAELATLKTPTADPVVLSTVSNIEGLTATIQQATAALVPPTATAAPGTSGSASGTGSQTTGEDPAPTQSSPTSGSTGASTTEASSSTGSTSDQSNSAGSGAAPAGAGTDATGTAGEPTTTGAAQS